MAKFTISNFRPGLKVMIDGNPHVMIESEFVKPGKGQAFSRAKLRNLITGNVLERTFKQTESLESADVADVDMQYLNNDGIDWHFMQPESFEQYTAKEDAVGDAKKWMKEQDVCIVTLYNGAPLSVTPPNSVVLKIVETDPGVRGDTSGGGGKPATMETGAVVRVPLFVQTGELIKVDTRTGEYISRVKE